jgi:SAM-dependent methyltransferase
VSVLAAAACDLCGSTDGHPRFSLATTEVISCRGCGLSFVAPRPPADLVLARVQQWAAADVLDPERLRIAFNAGHLRRWHRYLGWLERATRSGGRRLLDVGCSTGALLDVARERDWQGEGVEIGHASATYARETLGLTVHERSLYDFAPAGRYDAIVMLEVLEHMHSPLAALRRLSAWLVPGGVLLLSTPNFDSLFRRLCGPRWWVVNCEDEHLHFFSVATLTRALDMCGFDVLRLRVRGFDVGGMIGAVRAASRGGAAPSAEAGYRAERSTREQWKARLDRVGALALARRVYGALELVTSTRWSPVYGLGEQLVVVARRRETDR